jgi:far upstream element-binding protein
MVGLVIGRGGETIRSLQERTGASVQVSKDVTNHNGDREVRLGGSKSQIDEVRREIEQLIEQQKQRTGGDGGGGGYGGGGGGGDGYGERKESKIIYVPSQHVGSVIGRAGDVIKRLQLETGARIQVSREQNAPNREVTLEGTKSQIERAENEIKALVEEGVQRGGGGGGGGMGGGSNRSMGGNPREQMAMMQQQKQSAMNQAMSGYGYGYDPWAYQQGMGGEGGGGEGGGDQAAQMQQYQMMMQHQTMMQQQMQSQQMASMTPEQKEQWQAYYTQQQATYMQQMGMGTDGK